MEELSRYHLLVGELIQVCVIFLLRITVLDKAQYVKRTHVDRSKKKRDYPLHR